MSEINWNALKREAPEWFRDAKFGVFIHWGPYCVPAYQNEWYSRNMYTQGLEQNLYHEKTYGKLSEFGYKDFYPMMKGEKYDAEAWADLVKRSGARYAGPVTEHCDNFSMWDSKVNPVNSLNYGPGKDVVGECTEAFRKRGIKMVATFHHQWLWGWFMSTDNEADVYDPANEKFYGPALPLETNRYIPYRYPDAAFVKTWKDKIIEVIDRYQPDVLYFDSRTCIIEEEARYQVADYFYHSEGGKDGVLSYKQEDFPEGTGVSDFEKGRFSAPKPFVWQSDDRLEDNVTWCMVQEPKYKSSESIIHQLSDIVAKNGNLLLNVGPYADGSFHPEAVSILYEIGDWLEQNGEAIFETRPFVVAAEGPTVIQDTHYDSEQIEEQIDAGGETGECSNQLSEQDFRFTTKGEILYTICMGWPEKGEYHVATLGEGGPFRSSIESVTMIGSEEALQWHRDKDALHVKVPSEKPCESAFVLKING